MFFVLARFDICVIKHVYSITLVGTIGTGPQRPKRMPCHHWGELTPAVAVQLLVAGKAWREWNSSGGGLGWDWQRPPPPNPVPYF